MIFIFFIFGLVIGSFLNVVIFRLEKKEGVVKGRSHCPYCKKPLSFLELIPVVSFILQKGKCRKCHKKISWQYPLVELTTGVLFALVYNFQFSIFNFQSIFNLQFLISIIFWLFVVSCLIVIFVYDLKRYIIPNEVIYSGIVLAFIFRILNLFGNWKLKIENLEQFINPVLAAIFAGSFFLAIILISRGKWMGMGDVKLAVFMGLILGWPNILVALFLAFFIGAIISVVLIIFKKKTLKSQIPFGPFLSGATVITLFFGNILIDWYLNLFI